MGSGYAVLQVDFIYWFKINVFLCSLPSFMLIEGWKSGSEVNKDFPLS